MNGAAYAAELLTELARAGLPLPVTADWQNRPELTEHPAQRWLDTGLMALTGDKNEPGQFAPIPLPSCADAVFALLEAATGKSLGDGQRGANFLTERAAIMGLSRNGRIAPGGSCRILSCLDGDLALNLAREDDWDMVPAWLEQEVEADDWAGLAMAISGRSVSELIERGRLLGLPLAAVDGEAPQQAWFSQLQPAEKKSRAADGRPIVVDLSSLWAGPLCSHLLQAAGARVIRVESTHRPDGAREGNAEFHDLLNAGKQSVALDFREVEHIARLKLLLRHADIVIEASRPRALNQLGIDADEIVAAIPGLTWISLTAYGREAAAGEWLGFGDDVGVAGGLSKTLREATGTVGFVGDAIADPLTGLHAALLAWAGWQNGGGGLLSVAMQSVVMKCANFPETAGQSELMRRWADWQQKIAGYAATPPRSRAASGRAAALGEHTDAVFEALQAGTL